MKISILTLGCKVNQAESRKIVGDLLSSGHNIVSLKDNPDVCIVNTCSVTAKSDYQSRQYIRRALRSGKKVYVTGCYSELNGNDVSEISDDITVISNTNKSFIINEFNREPEISRVISLKQKSRHFVKIQDGCNNACTYCAIHIARGQATSVPASEIIEEIQAAHNAGINEVVLTGIHIGFYGIDLKGKYALNNLIYDILKNTSIPRVRLSSLEASEINDALIDLLSDARICQHLHIPLQAGHDSILEKMGRNYTTSKYRTTIDRIIERYPDISLGTDVIAGFPGEDSTLFESAYQFIEKTPFSYLHVFPFSKRDQAPAGSFPMQVSSHEKTYRVKRLRTLSEMKKTAYGSRFPGKVLDVIIEQRTSSDTFTGTAGNYLKVLVKGSTLRKGSLVYTRIQEAVNGTLSAVAQNTAQLVDK